MGSYCSRVDPEPRITGVLLKRGSVNTGMHTGRISYKGEDRDQGMPLQMKKPPETRREGQNECSIAASEGPPTLISGFQPPEL